MEQNVLAQWITNGADRPFYARKKFTLSEKIRRAEVTVCGLGQFNLYINGKKVGDYVLDPAWSDYRKLIYYLKFDVTEMLAEEELSRLLGEKVRVAEKAARLYQTAARGGRDNITVLLVQVV